METITPNPDPERVIAENPLLKAFLSTSVPGDPITMDEFEKVRVKMQETLGEIFVYGVLPQMTFAGMLGLYQSELPSPEEIQDINIVAAIGYQIGDRSDALSVTPMIVDKLVEKKILKVNDATHSALNAFVFNLLTTSVSWRNNFDKTPDVFEDFINKLDLD